MKLSIAAFAIALSLPLFGCLDNDPAEDQVEDKPTSSVVHAAGDAPTASVVHAAGVAESAAVSSLGASTSSEQTYWRCPPSRFNYRTLESCSQTCNVACRPVLVCTDSNGAPILCP